MHKAKLTFALLAASMLLLKPVQSGVLGIDFGSQYYKISMIRPGRPFTMVENLYSKTKTYNGITFYDKQRLLEYDANAKASRNTKNAFIFTPKFFGKTKDDAQLNELIKLQHANNNIVKEANGSLFFELDNFPLPNSKGDFERLTNTTSILRFEEIVAMVLEHAKTISDKFGKTKFSDVVFTIPPWWTPRENEVLYAAAKLAGFNPIALVAENTAAAVYMGIERKSDAKDKTVLFYNMGAQSTKVSVVKFDKWTNPKNNKTTERVTLLGEGWDETLGGYELDWCVVERFAKAFDEKHGTDVINNPKVMRRLLKSGNKLKEVLSANKDSTMIVEEVYDYKDFKLKYTRAEFETLCKASFDRVQQPIADALERAGVTAKDIDEIEILGGSVRVPKVKQLIEEKMGMKVSMHMNGDDSMALGASFIAANNTATFRVKNVIVEHGPNYQVDVVIEDPLTLGTDDEYKKTAVLFKNGQNYGSRKKLNLNYGKNVEVELSIPLPGEGDQKYTTRYNITGVDKLLEKEKYQKMKNPRISLGFTLDYLGIPFVSRAELLLDKEVIVESVKDKKDDKKKDDKKKDDKKKDEKKKDEKKDEEKKDEKKEDDGTEAKKKLKTIHKELKIDVVSRSSTSMLHDAEAIQESIGVLKEFKDYETLLKRNSQAKNKLESLIYHIQDLMENEETAKFASEEERKNLTQTATDLDDWMFSDEAAQGNYTLYNKKFKESNKLVKKVESRRNEDRNRPGALSEAHKSIDQFETTISKMNKTRPWLKKEDIQGGLDDLEKHRKWLEDKVVEQAEREKHLEPVITTADIQMRVASVQEIIYRLRRIKRPEKKKAKKGKKGEKVTVGGTGDDFKISDEMMEEIKRKMKEQEDEKKNYSKILEDIIEKQKAEEKANGAAGDAEKPEGEAEEIVIEQSSTTTEEATTEEPEAQGEEKAQKEDEAPVDL